MNRDQKAAVIEQVTADINEAEAVFAVDYRGLSVPQAADLRTRLRDADAAFKVVKNTLTERAADQAGAAELRPYLQGPTAMAFVRGDAALAAKALSDFRRTSGLLTFKGGWMNGSALTAEQIDAIARLPSREVLVTRLVGGVAAPLTGLAGALSNLVGGLARQLAQIAEQGLVSGDAPPPPPSPSSPPAASESAEPSAPPEEVDPAQAAAEDPDAEAPDTPPPGPSPDPEPSPTDAQEA